MRYFLILTCLLFGTGAMADEAELDFKSNKAKAAVQKYQDASRKSNKRNLDSLIRSLEAAFKHERTDGDFEEAIKIRDTIKTLEKGASPPDANGLLKDLIGTWRFFGTSTITFHRDGTVTGSWGGNGRWEREKRRVVIIWPDTTSRDGHPEWRSFDFPIDPTGVSGDGWGGPGFGGSPGKLK